MFWGVGGGSRGRGSARDFPDIPYFKAGKKTMASSVPNHRSIDFNGPRLKLASSYPHRLIPQVLNRKLLKLKNSYSYVTYSCKRIFIMYM